MLLSEGMECAAPGSSPNSACPSATTNEMDARRRGRRTSEGDRINWRGDLSLDAALLRLREQAIAQVLPSALGHNVEERIPTAQSLYGGSNCEQVSESSRSGEDQDS